jgi:hypothetical protein
VPPHATKEREFATQPPQRRCVLRRVLDALDSDMAVELEIARCAHHRKRSAPGFAGDAVALAACEGRAAAAAALVPRLLALTLVFVDCALWRRRVVAQLACEVLELAFGAQPLRWPLVPVLRL